jgi:hypothetical protein
MKRKKQPIIGNEALDGRTKLSSVEQEDILRAYNSSTSWNHAKVARSYNVSATTIKYIVNPELLKKNREQLIEKGGHYKVYNSPEKNKIITKKYRTKKKQIIEMQKKSNVFAHLKNIQDGVAIDKIELKKGNTISDVEIISNEKDKKILSTRNHGNIFYEDVKSFEVTASRQNKSTTPIAKSFESQYSNMLSSMRAVVKRLDSGKAYQEKDMNYEELIEAIKSLEKLM